MNYEELGKIVGKLVDEKQKAYGDSFHHSGKVMEILYPDGIKPDQYQDALCVVRIIDKLFRIATMKDYGGESPFQDIAGYGLLGMPRVKTYPTFEDYHRENYENKEAFKAGY